MDQLAAACTDWKKNGLSDPQTLADAAGVDLRALKRFLSGDGFPSAEVVSRLARALRLKLVWPDGRAVRRKNA